MRKSKAYLARRLYAAEREIERLRAEAEHHRAERLGWHLLLIERGLKQPEGWH